jgi:hypothetical protein
MGQEYSCPKEGVELKVIGAGMPRTGTASFSRALEILLDGPVYHGGTQTTLGPEKEIKTWIKVLSQWPPSEDGAKHENLDLIRRRTKGFAAITDAPGSGLVPELIELYPDAKVVCTVRDAASWQDSMRNTGNAASKWFLRFVLFPVPSMRYFVDYINCLRDQWLIMYTDADPPTARTYEEHISWLRSKVPEDRLVFFNVKDGWEPLCQALDLPVPDGIPFPMINDGKAIEAFAKRQVGRGLKRWAGITLVIALLAAAGVKWMF